MTSQLDLGGAPELDFTSERAKEYGVGYTPEDVVQLIVDRLNEENWDHDGTGMSILDPAAGSGVFGSVCRDMWPKANIYGVEIRVEEPEHPDYNGWFHMDAFEYAANCRSRFSLIITNPDFKLARQYVEAFRPLLSPGGRLVLLLRSSWWQRSQELYRWAMASAHRPGQIRDYPNLWKWEHPVGGAISFYGPTKPGSDSHSYSFFEWPAKIRSHHYSIPVGWETYPFPSIPARRSWKTPPGRR